jgi:holin-like protein
MLTAISILIGCELIGEILSAAFHLSVPGPVIGMFLLAGTLVIVNRRRRPDDTAVPPSLEQAAETLIAQMGLLFVPAGVGLIAEAGLLRQAWLPIIAALIGSTVLSLTVTGLVMHWVTHLVEIRKKAQAPIAGLNHQEIRP